MYHIVSGGISLSTHSFHVLGGTPLTITLDSDCLQISFLIKCAFGSTEADAMYINESTAYCVSPRFRDSRVVLFAFTASNSDGVQFQDNRYVYIC